ncbi:Reversion-to-ethylene sensitivity1 [Heracleum sosnowskyi]|uniref:Reversion-to-ethylene sensitivity1 n=1 Tax=Heracleum sosnowskyi TaxID=360622 RepID=A0AAD8HCG0_9APIA|nr:Reversion-to-ethylene sensitivity1 [Heracleum sosnowskyi]
MEQSEDPEHGLMMKYTSPQPLQIDPERSRFPCCIVWTPIPVLSWFVPFIGHMGLCREDGVILDFAGPNFVCVDNFTFGAVARYIRIDEGKCYGSPKAHGKEYKQDEGGTDALTMTWDNALKKGTQEYQHLAYNILTCNCHSFVANNLNRLKFRNGGWNVVNLAAMIFLKGQWVNKAAMARSLVPFVLVFGTALYFGGVTFLAFWAFFTFLLVGWFLLGTYCFRDLIHL